jgi:hypothetical protein
MKVFNTENLIGGWFVGDFENSCYKTQACEVSYKIHKQGEFHAAHYHKLADEINYLMSGKMQINGTELSAPCVFIIEKNEVAKPIFHTDVYLIVVKIPGPLNDKYIVEN